MKLRVVKYSMFVKVTEPKSDGVASGHNQQNPSKSSLIFISPLVNHCKMRVLIDTGATTTFINEKSLRKTKHPKYINKQQKAFVLADGLVPFHVLVVIELCIKIGTLTTKIYVHVAKHLCTDIILGMDYINRYNLNIDIKNQTITIETNNKTWLINIDKDTKPEILPVMLAKSVNLPPNSNSQTTVSIPISSITSPFILNSRFKQNTSLVVAHKLLSFQFYYSTIMLSNDSSYRKFIEKGLRIDYLFCYALPDHHRHAFCCKRKTFGAASSGVIPVDSIIIRANMKSP
ncbi:unnamed protein product [Didymodactylos carnosus]|uniref:Peptidase A2 domain-containing protein n=1 Tax=Didymodactylos carnosus TaxID=1234261 RepID=A0A8S2F2K3_9BILA|nr:unnamed protein product [Didymodactylos carnosus]CAF4133148.1 unnamed protein product [Didymodactylos carnosus]